MLLPERWRNRLWSLPFVTRPELLVAEVSDCPTDAEMQYGRFYVEVRGGFLKWSHLLCPRCGDHVELPMKGTKAWSLRVDFLGRPTLAPSVWEAEGCGAHFFVRKGRILWCE